MKSHDAIIIGGGVIGLSLALALRKQGIGVLIVERGELGREASYAAAGMLVGEGNEIPPPLKALASDSAQMYPEFVHELQDESGVRIDFREQGTILLQREATFPQGAKALGPDQVQSLEPLISQQSQQFTAAYVRERSVDPRTLMQALIKAAKHRRIDISSGSVVNDVLVENGRASGVQTDKTSYPAGIVVNCAGAWAGQISPHQLPVRPIRGQMLAVVGGPALGHVIRGDDVYLVPRTDGRIVIGSTLEDAGFNKQTDVDTIEALYRAAKALIPDLAKARQHEAWTGLRPGTPDDLPILGESSTRGYFFATGHYRDGILLAPVTAVAVTDLLCRRSCAHDLKPFSASRFS